MDLDRLKLKLFEKKKTYEDCAKAIGVGTTTFSNKMNGQVRFYVDELVALLQYLDCDLEEMHFFLLKNCNLITGKGEKHE